MRITAPSCSAGVFACVFLAGLALGATAEPETPYTRIAKLAMYISAGDTVGALDAFDKGMKGYGAVTQNLGALATQTDVLCSIDIVADKEADNEASDVHHLDLDWYMMLKSRLDEGLVERRRQRVAVTIQRVKAKSGNSKDSWRITALDPQEILAPQTIR